MSKLIQAILTGVFITFILDFFIFLGIKQNYIDFYEIDLYYNILFADNQNLFVFLLSSVLLGLFSTYVKSRQLVISTIGLLFILSLSTLVPSVGYKVGELMLMQKQQTLKNAKHIFRGDIYYDGRKNITFYDYELKKIIRLDRTEVILDKKDLIR
jgi:hypothetical protein